MKALEQNYRRGTLKVVDVSEPKAGQGRVIVRTAASLASVGTEKSMVELARKSLLGKARSRPDLVKQVIDKVRTDGIMETWRQVMGRLDTPILLGYSSAGTVVDVGSDVTGFRAGDRVACGGSGSAGHVEVASVPLNLCTTIPDGVSFEEASFVALGGIALESVRMAHVELGDRVVVIGLGLLLPLRARGHVSQHVPETGEASHGLEMFADELHVIANRTDAYSVGWSHSGHHSNLVREKPS